MTYGASRTKYVTYTTEIDGLWMSRARGSQGLIIDLTAIVALILYATGIHILRIQFTMSR